MLGGDTRSAPRVVLALVGLFGLVTIGWMAAERRFMFMVNYLPYHRAAEAVLAGEDLYAVAHPDAPAYHFLYPPVTALAWVPATGGPPIVGFAVQTAVSLAFGLAIGVVAWRLVEAQGVTLGGVDRALLVWAGVGSSAAIPTYVYGNVNVILAGSLAVGIWLLYRDRPVAAGVAFGLPGLVKVFPAAFGLWLVRLRRERAAVAWMATGAAGLAAGAVVFGLGTTERWIDEALVPRTEPDLFVGGLPPHAGYVSLRQPIALVLGVDGLVATAIAVGMVAPVVVVLARRVDDLEGRLLALLGIVAGTLLVLPTYYVYLVLLFPAVLPLVYLLEPGAERGLFLAGVVLLGLTIAPSSIEPLAGAMPTVHDAAVVAMRVARPPLVGLVLVLIGALLAVRRRADASPSTASHL